MSDTEPSFDGDRLTMRDATGNEREARFPWPIRQVIAAGSVTFVRVEPDPGACFNENIFAIDSAGAICWQIPRMKHAYADSPYTHIQLVEGGVKADNWDGLSVIVEPSTLGLTQAVRGR